MELEMSKSHSSTFLSKLHISFHKRIQQSKREEGKEMYESKKSRKEAEERLLCMRNRINRLKQEVESSNRTNKLQAQRSQKLLEVRERFSEFKNDIHDKSNVIKKEKKKTSNMISQTRIERKQKLREAKDKSIDQKKKISQEMKNIKDSDKKYVQDCTHEANLYRKCNAKAQNDKFKEQVYKRVQSDESCQEAMRKSFKNKIEEQHNSKDFAELLIKQLIVEERKLKDELKINIQ